MTGPHDLSLQAPAAEAEGGRARCAGGRYHEKEPPPKQEKRRLSFFLNDPAGPGRGSATQHRAMRNVTAVTSPARHINVAALGAATADHAVRRTDGQWSRRGRRVAQPGRRGERLFLSLPAAHLWSQRREVGQWLIGVRQHLDQAPRTPRDRIIIAALHAGQADAAYEFDLPGVIGERLHDGAARRRLARSLSAAWIASRRFAALARSSAVSSVPGVPSKP